MGAASVGKGLLCLCQQPCPSLPVNLAMTLSLCISAGQQGWFVPSQVQVGDLDPYLGQAETQQTANRVCKDVGEGQECLESPETMSQGWAGIPGWRNQFMPFPGVGLCSQEEELADGVQQA